LTGQLRFVPNGPEIDGATVQQLVPVAGASDGGA